jgi:hypothetical protein
MRFIEDKKKRKSLHLYIFLFILSNFVYAQVPPKHILLEKCLFSYTKTYKHLKKNKAFAYARVAIGEEDYCTWTQGMYDVSSAQKIALEACKKVDMNATCKIVDVNDVWITKEGDFSTVIPADNTPLSAQKRADVIKEVEDIVLGECLDIFKRHLDDKGHKVFAYSIDEDGNFACATSKEHQTLRKAAIVAIKKCEDHKKTMQGFTPKMPCLSLFDGKNILANAKDFNITLDKKPNVFVDQKMYKEYVEEVKEKLYGACLVQYKYYIRNIDHKAFYIAKGKKGKLVCGLSFGGFTIASAKKEARKKCEDAAKRKKIDAKCELFSLNQHLIVRNQ